MLAGTIGIVMVLGALVMLGAWQRLDRAADRALASLTAPAEEIALEAQRPQRRAPVVPPRPPSVQPGYGMPAPRAPLPATAPTPSAPQIAILIDDVGLDKPRSRALMALPGPMTFAFMPYADDLSAQVALARRGGHEIMLHMPMEPNAAGEDPGPRALYTAASPREVLADIEWMLGRLNGYVGVNNHMGSRFTAQPAGMRLVLDALKARGLFFVDSRTTKETVGYRLAQEIGVPTAERDIFIDDDPDPGVIRRWLRETEKLAKRRGYAMAIGHPRRNTVAALEDWVPGLARRGFRLVTVSRIVEIDEARRAPAVQLARRDRP